MNFAKEVEQNLHETITLFLSITINYNIEIWQTMWKIWNQSGKSYFKKSHYMNKKSPPYGEQDLCVNALAITMYWCGIGGIGKGAPSIVVALGFTQL